LCTRNPAARGAGGEDRGVAAVQVEGDDREGERADRADPGGEAVDAVAEVDDVHHRHQADDRDRAGGAAEVHRAQERRRDVADLDARADRDDRRDDLTGQLDRRVQVEAVVDRADERDQRAADEDADEAVVGAGRRLDEQQPGDQRARVDRQPAEQRRGLAAQAARLRLVDRAHPPGEARRQRRQDHRHRERGNEGVDRVELRHRP
jgi:hypothetical protein